MQQSMDNVQFELAHQRIASSVDATPSSRVFLSKFARVAPRGLGTDKDFAVLKREHVSRSDVFKKFSMKHGHPPIGNEPDEDLVQAAQVSSFFLSQLQTAPHRPCRKLFKLLNIDCDLSLTIPHGEPRR
jgi:hypothetical protein